MGVLGGPVRWTLPSHARPWAQVRWHPPGLAASSASCSRSRSGSTCSSAAVALGGHSPFRGRRVDLAGRPGALGRGTRQCLAWPRGARCSAACSSCRTGTTWRRVCRAAEVTMAAGAGHAGIRSAREAGSALLGGAGCVWGRAGGRGLVWLEVGEAGWRARRARRCKSGVKGRWRGCACRDDANKTAGVVWQGSGTVWGRDLWRSADVCAWRFRDKQLRRRAPAPAPSAIQTASGGPRQQRQEAEPRRAMERGSVSGSLDGSRSTVFAARSP